MCRAPISSSGSSLVQPHIDLLLEKFQSSVARRISENCWRNPMTCIQSVWSRRNTVVVLMLMPSFLFCFCYTSEKWPKTEAPIENSGNYDPCQLYRYRSNLFKPWKLCGFLVGRLASNGADIERVLGNSRWALLNRGNDLRKAKLLRPNNAHDAKIKQSLERVSRQLENRSRHGRHSLDEIFSYKRYHDNVHSIANMMTWNVGIAYCYREEYRISTRVSSGNISQRRMREYLHRYTFLERQSQT